ncbi:MAG: MmcB family DNA repair protein [Pseudomonadota bacterium]
MAAGRPAETARLLRGARRWLATRGFEALPEFRPSRNLRVDLLAVGPGGEIWILEIKSGVADFQADRKWRGYLEWCDRFFFCVGSDFPKSLAPEEVGLIEADSFGAEIVREAPATPLAPARRKALLLRVARDALARLRRSDDPGSEAMG